MGRYAESARSPPSRAAWIEIIRAAVKDLKSYRRRLHGRRGLKSLQAQWAKSLRQSPPSRAAWIEMLIALRLPQVLDRRRLHGRRGLKSSLWCKCFRCTCRRLHGRRGLKFGRKGYLQRILSRRLHGRRGLKCQRVPCMLQRPRSPPSRAAWIEITLRLRRQCYRTSPPSRAAWIEIFAAALNPAMVSRRRLHGRRGLK